MNNRENLENLENLEETRDSSGSKVLDSSKAASFEQHGFHIEDSYIDVESHSNDSYNKRPDKLKILERACQTMKQTHAESVDFYTEQPLTLKEAKLWADAFSTLIQSGFLKKMIFTTTYVPSNAEEWKALAVFFEGIVLNNAYEKDGVLVHRLSHIEFNLLDFRLNEPKMLNSFQNKEFSNLSACLKRLPPSLTLRCNGPAERDFVYDLIRSHQQLKALEIFDVCDFLYDEEKEEVFSIEGEIKPFFAEFQDVLKKNTSLVKITVPFPSERDEQKELFLKKLIQRNQLILKAPRYKNLILHLFSNNDPALKLDGLSLSPHEQKLHEIISDFVRKPVDLHMDLHNFDTGELALIDVSVSLAISKILNVPIQKDDQERLGKRDNLIRDLSQKASLVRNQISSIENSSTSTAAAWVPESTTPAIDNLPIQTLNNVGEKKQSEMPFSSRNSQSLFAPKEESGKTGLGQQKRKRPEDIEGACKPDCEFSKSPDGDDDMQEPPAKKIKI